MYVLRIKYISRELTEVITKVRHYEGPRTMASVSGKRWKSCRCWNEIAPPNFSYLSTMLKEHVVLCDLPVSLAPVGGNRVVPEPETLLDN